MVQRTINLVNPFIAVVKIEESALPYIADNTPRTISGEVGLSANVIGLSGATVEITEGYIQGEDVLVLPAQSGGGISAAFDAASGTLTLQGAASLVQYEQALQAVQYLNQSPTSPSSFSKTVSFAIVRNGLTSNTLSRGIEISQPLVALSGLSTGVLPYFSEGSTGGVLNPNLTITSSGSTLTEATLQITEGYQAGADLLAMPVLPGNLRWTWNKAEGRLRIWGQSSLANYQQALRGVIFQHLGNQAEGVRKITIHLTNGIFSTTAVQERSLLAPVASPYAENFQFPADAVVNILSYGADLNKGQVDATAAIQQAINDHSGDIAHRTTIYFPDGVYRVTNSLVLTHTTTPTSSGNGKGMVISGQSREGTILKLDDGAAGFQNKTAPKPLLSYGGNGAASATGFTNIAFMNNLFNVTLNTGSGNAGAIGLIYIANNQGSVRNVLIKSGDGDGWAALDMDRARIPGPALLKHVTTEGFDYGVRVVGANYGMTAEHLTINNAKVAALYNDKHIFSIRKLTTSGTGGASVMNVHADGFITLIDSDLSGSGNAAIENEGFLLARNISVAGYTNSLNDHGQLLAGDIAEYLYNPMNEGKAFSAFDNRSNTSLNLGEGNIPETPEVAWDDLASWVSVTDFGYQPGTAAQPNFDDALPAVRAAIAFMNEPGNEHKTTLYFPPGDYRLGGVSAEAVNILVEGNVRRIIGNFAALFTKTSIEAGTAGLYKIGDLKHPSLIIENLNIVPQFGPDRLKRMGVFENSSAVELVLRNVYIGHGKAYKNAGATGKLFLEDVCALSHHYYVKGSEEFVYPEAVPQFEFGNQEVWARQFNPEQFGDLYQSVVQVDGGQLWVLGLKTEDRGIFHAKNAKMEILGGTILPSFDVKPEQPWFLVENSEVSISVGEQSRALTSTTVAGYYTRLVEERRDGVTRTLERDQAPGRLVTTNPAAPTGFFGFVLPMYVSKKVEEQSIDFASIPNKVFGDAPFTLEAQASSGLPVTFEVLEGPATVSENEVTITGVGAVTIQATQAGNEVFKAALPQTQEFMVNPKEQSLDFSAIADKVYGDAPFILVAEASSGLAVTFEVLEGPATVSGNEVTITGVGKVIIQATQAGNEFYKAAPALTQEFTVAPAEQTLVFAPIPDKVFGDAPFALQAQASSGLPVTFQVLAGPATVAGNQVTITGVGTVTIQATQPGNDLYKAAPAQTQQFKVAYVGAANMIKPKILCVTDNGNGTYTARFGYMNKNNFMVYIPAGSRNILTGSISGTVPEYFMPGDVAEAFSLIFDGKRATWTVEGIDGKKERDDAATANSPVCKLSTQQVAAAREESSAETGSDKPKLQLYPNPASTQVSLTLAATEKQDVTIRIFTLNGSMIVQQQRQLEAGTNLLQVDVEKLATGLYMVVTEGKNLFHSSKLSIQR